MQRAAPSVASLVVTSNQGTSAPRVAALTSRQATGTAAPAPSRSPHAREGGLVAAPHCKIQRGHRREARGGRRAAAVASSAVADDANNDERRGCISHQPSSPDGAGSRRHAILDRRQGRHKYKKTFRSLRSDHRLAIKHGERRPHCVWGGPCNAGWGVNCARNTSTPANGAGLAPSRPHAAAKPIPKR